MSTYTIDTNVKFELANGRAATVDALELADFKDQLFETSGVVDADGTKRLTWPAIVAATSAWVAEHSNEKTQLTRAEAVAVWQHASVAWDEKKSSWGPPAAAPPISPPSTDPRFSD